MSGEKITYGIKNVYYALKSVSDLGVVTYGPYKALPGAAEISLPPVGDAVKVYADNMVYVKMRVNQGYEGTLSIYNIPDSFAEDVLGVKIDENGVLIEDVNAIQRDFALAFEFDTDTAKTKRNVLYNCSAGRPDLNGATQEESVDPEAFSIPITAAPAEDTAYVKASILGDSTNNTWSSWFSSVYVPIEAQQFKVTVVVQNSTNPIAGALVVCGEKIGKTDSSGKAYFMQPAGEYDVLVSAGGYVADTDSVTVSTSDTTKTITLTVV